MQYLTFFLNVSSMYKVWASWIQEFENLAIYNKVGVASSKVCWFFRGDLELTVFLSNAIVFKYQKLLKKPTQKSQQLYLFSLCFHSCVQITPGD